MWKHFGRELSCCVENICARTIAPETLLHLFGLMRQFLAATHITEESAIPVLPYSSSSRNDLVSSELQIVLTEVIYFLLFPHLHPTCRTPMARPDKTASSLPYSQPCASPEWCRPPPKRRRLSQRSSSR